MTWYNIFNIVCTQKNLSLIAFLPFLAFKIMTSKEIHNANKMKCALGGVHYAEQMEVLKKALYYFENLRFKTEKMTSYTKKQFQTGASITINGVIKLQKILKDDHNVESFCTINVVQDYVERQFGLYRVMGGSCTNPPALEFQRKVAQDLRCTLLADPEYDLLKNKPNLDSPYMRDTSIDTNFHYI